MQLDDFIIFTEVDRGPAFAAGIYQRKYGAEARVPDFRHHVVAFWKRTDGSFVPVSYIHMTDWADIVIAGGGCTDGNVLRTMSPVEQQAIQTEGGIYLTLTRYYIARFAPRCEAIFACCGDARAWEINSQCGYERVGDPHLIARWSRPLDEHRKRELINKAAAFAPF